MSADWGEPRIVRARGDVAVWEVGAGDPVLVLHGFPDCPQGLRPLVARLAAAGFRCLVPSLPGYDPSGPVDDYRTAAAIAAAALLCSFSAWRSSKQCVLPALQTAAPQCTGCAGGQPACCSR